MIRPHEEAYTADEFYDIVPDGQKADLIDGVIYLASPDSKQADDLTGFLLTLLRMYVRLRKLGEVTGSRYAYRLTDFRAPEPDVAFVSSERAATVITKREGLGAPDIAIEVVARDSKTRDYGEKKSLYEQSGVQEYWIVDPLLRRAEFWRLVGGSYQMVALERNSVFRSTALTGFWLDVNWLFGEQMPAEYDCLKEILQ